MRKQESGCIYARVASIQPFAAPQIDPSGESPKARGACVWLGSRCLQHIWPSRRGGAHDFTSRLPDVLDIRAHATIVSVDLPTLAWMIQIPSVFQLRLIPFTWPFVLLSQPTSHAEVTRICPSTPSLHLPKAPPTPSPTTLHSHPPPDPLLGDHIPSTASSLTINIFACPAWLLPPAYNEEKTSQSQALPHTPGVLHLS